MMSDDQLVRGIETLRALARLGVCPTCGKQTRGRVQRQVSTFSGVPVVDDVTCSHEYHVKRDELQAIEAGRGCTGLSASWCPIHGDCTCTTPGELDEAHCALHGIESTHGDDR